MTATEDRTGLEETLATISERLEQTVRVQEELQQSVSAILRLLSLGTSGAYPESLTARRFRITSHNEEDGITYALLQAIGPPLRRFVEIGAGPIGGNTAFLASELAFEGLMVDATEESVQGLRKTIPLGKVTLVMDWATAENINQLVADNGLTGEIDVFSLAIEGNDYWVWKALEACKPRIVIVEYNSLFGPERRLTIPYDPQFVRTKKPPLRGGYYGASLLALASLGESKGYRLVVVEPEGINAFFLRSDLAPDIPSLDPRAAFRVSNAHRKLLQKDYDIVALAEQAGVEVVEV